MIQSTGHLVKGPLWVEQRLHPLLSNKYAKKHSDLITKLYKFSAIQNPMTNLYSNLEREGEGGGGKRERREAFTHLCIL